MNRLESIKERNGRRKKLMYDRRDEFAMFREVEYQGLVEKSVEDTAYLLQRLEIAQKALVQFEQLYDPNINKSVSEVIETVKRMAKEALDQLKEE